MELGGMCTQNHRWVQGREKDNYIEKFVWCSGQDKRRPIDAKYSSIASISNPNLLKTPNSEWKCIWSFKEPEKNTTLAGENKEYGG